MALRIRVDDKSTYGGWRWVERYKPPGDAIESRSISVQLAGLRPAQTRIPGRPGLGPMFARSPDASTYPPPLRCSCPDSRRPRNGTRFMAYQPGPNELLRSARSALWSPSGSGRPLSRQELAEAVNVYLYEHAGRRFAIHAGYIGTLERGQTRWPSAHYRTALRAVLGKTTDAELGFFIIQGHANDPDLAAAEPPPPAALSQAVPPDLQAATPPAVALTRRRRPRWRTAGRSRPSTRRWCR
jgi:transcriptional regulator with XRE-family HTH domain